MSKTFDLYEAADFLKVHWQTLRVKAKAGEIPCAKISKRWVFLEEDLVSYLRSKYSVTRPKSQVQQNIAGGTLCCTNDTNRAIGGASSPHLTESAYKNLLKL